MSKRQAIISAALKLLVEKGIHDTPMSAIAREAGTGMGTIYNYFPHKESLINAVYVEIKQAESAIFYPYDQSKPLRTHFEEFYVRSIDFYVANPMYFQFMEQVQASPMITAESKEVGYESIEHVLDLLSRGKKARVIKDIPTNELIQFVGGTVISFLRQQIQEGKESSMTNQLKMVWDAIRE